MRVCTYAQQIEVMLKKVFVFEVQVQKILLNFNPHVNKLVNPIKRHIPFKGSVCMCVWACRGELEGNWHRTAVANLARKLSGVQKRNSRVASPRATLEQRRLMVMESASDSTAIFSLK